MELKYVAEGKTLSLNDFQVSADDDDSSILLTNTNKLLTAVGISAKKIISTEELSRVASSLFVAVFESLFHQKIEGVIRNPRSKEDYENNAQLVIDNLSDQIQLDLKHITGRSIVSGDVRVLSNLVHILLRIVSLTSQESLTSYDSSDFLRDKLAIPLEERYRNVFITGSAGQNAHKVLLKDNDSISTRQSTFEEDPEDRKAVRRKFLQSYNGNIIFNEDLKRSMAKAEKFLQYEKKLDAARKRRENVQFLKESRVRAANFRHAGVSNAALQSRWVADAERSRKSYHLKQSSEEQVLLRKIYQGLLRRVMKWKIEAEKEEKVKKAQRKEQVNWQLESIQRLFEERLYVLSQDSASLRNRQSRDTTVETELSLAQDLLRSIGVKNDKLIEEEQVNLQQQRSRELIRRSEAHKNLLAMLAMDKWEDTLRAIHRVK